MEDNKKAAQGVYIVMLEKVAKAYREAGETGVALGDILGVSRTELYELRAKAVLHLLATLSQAGGMPYHECESTFTALAKQILNSFGDHGHGHLTEFKPINFSGENLTKENMN